VAMHAPLSACATFTDAHEALLHARREIGAAIPERKLRVLDREALKIGALVREGFIDPPTATDSLWDAAVANDLGAILGDDGLQHLLSEAFAGRTSLAPLQAQANNSGSAPVVAIDILDFLALDLPPRELMLSPWLPAKGLALLHAPRGVGKTHVAAGAAWAVATGGGFLRWTAPQPRRVVILDGEMPAAWLQERFRRIQERSELKPEPGYLRLAASDRCEYGLPDLSAPAAQQQYVDVVADAELVIVDNLSTLCRSYRENEADSWQPVQDWGLSLRRAGKSALFIHHSNRAGGQRGTSRKEDVLDTVIGLRRPYNYSADQGARFEIHFEKSRGFFGPDAEPFEAHLLNNGQWHEGPIKAEPDTDSLRAMRDSGMSFRQIETKTGVPKSTIERKLNGCPTGHG
jgi:AAA domain